jgi:hypothetical protein
VKNVVVSGMSDAAVGVGTNVRMTEAHNSAASAVLILPVFTMLDF